MLPNSSLETVPISMTVNISAQNIRGLLLDIEGTTTPIAFVYEVLFPFARAHVSEYLSRHLTDDDVRLDVGRLREEHAKDVADGLSPPPFQSSELPSIVGYVHWLMNYDRKSTGLKSLQGKVWEAGYRAGTLRSEVFPDVPAALERWHNDGLRVAIFSSGSVLAQQLLFAHTAGGDVTQFIDAYFDTTIGPKNDPDSYRRICSELHFNPEQVLFITDVSTELEAAIKAGLHSALCVRPGNPPQPKMNEQLIIRSLDDVKD